MPTETFDFDRLKPEQLSKLSEAEQQQLLTDVKAELARVEAKAKGAQREAIKKLQAQMTRHEAQAAWYEGEQAKLDALFARHPAAEDTPEQRKARQNLEVARTFCSSGRRMLTLELQGMKEDLTKVTGELASVAAEVENGARLADPFATFDWRLANAECDLAAVSLSMFSYEVGHRILAGALGVPRYAQPEADGPTSRQATTAALKSQGGSRSLTPTPVASGRVATSTLGLDESVPPPAEALPSDPLEAEPEVAEDPTADLTDEERSIVAMVDRRLQSDAKFEARARTIATQLAEINWMIRQGRDYLARVARVSPKEAMPLLQQAYWTRLNGKIYFLQRLGEQCADDRGLAALFPKIEIPVLPFEKPEDE